LILFIHAIRFMILIYMLDVNNPLTIFDLWYNEALRHSDIKEPSAMSLATSNKEGIISNRIVLLKNYSDSGFIFYTNLTSKKANELKENPHAALCFYWMPLDKQIRITGNIEKVANEVADSYFSSRPRQSQISAWASKQSMHLDRYETFENKISEIEKKFHDKIIPRPPFWSGFIVKPVKIEFWQQKEFRRHERNLFTKQANGWQREMLYP
jgi:pyridoxamine 5'-phosphate oxidase